LINEGVSIMATCKWCEKSGLFLRVSDNGLCGNCEQIVSADIEIIKKQIKESIDLVQNSNNTDTIVNRCDFLVEKLTYFEKYEEKGIKTIPNYIQVYLNYTLPNKRDELITEGIKREYKKFLLELGELKTIRGKYEKLIKFENRLGNLKNHLDFPESLIELESEISQIKEKLESNKELEEVINSNSKINISHLEILEKFLKPTSIDSLVNGWWGKNWWEITKKPLAKAIEKLIKGKYLETPILSSIMDYNFKLSELKELCKQRELKLSGKKAELIERLISFDEKGMSKLVENMDVYTCSQSGRKLADDYIETKRLEFDLAEKNVIKALEERNFIQATRTMINYESKQFFPRGMGINWKREKEEKYLPILTRIFDSTPKVLANTNKDKLEYLRVISGRNYLLSPNNWDLLSGLENVSEIYDNQTCVNLLYSYARNRTELENFHKLVSQYKNPGIQYRVKVNTCNDELVCEECKKAARKSYSLSGDIPELPHLSCKSEHGCRCWYVLDMIGF